MGILILCCLFLVGINSRASGEEPAPPRDPETENLQVSEGQVTNVKSPNYPKDAPGNLNKTWILTAPAGKKINLTCSDIRLFKESPCGPWILIIKDGGNKQEICDVIFDFKMVSTTNKVEITMGTGKWARGFLCCNASIASSKDQKSTGSPKEDGGTGGDSGAAGAEEGEHPKAEEEAYNPKGDSSQKAEKGEVKKEEGEEKEVGEEEGENGGGGGEDEGKDGGQGEGEKEEREKTQDEEPAAER